jgi:predicted histone-like DNA-binding protein
MAEHIMKHGSVYTEDVVIGVITKLKTCLQEMLADGYKVKLDGIGTLYPVLSSEGVADAKDYSPSENVTRVGISFLADQGKKSLFKARNMRNDVSLSTKLYNEMTGEEGLTPNATPHSQGENPSPSGEGSGNTGSGNTGGGNTGGNGGGGDEPGGDGNDQN